MFSIQIIYYVFHVVIEDILYADSIIYIENSLKLLEKLVDKQTNIIQFKYASVNETSFHPN